MDKNELELKAKYTVELPCKIGETVFYLSAFRNGILSGIVNEIIIYSKGIMYKILSKDKRMTRLEEDRIFLSYHEAEANLKEREGKK